MFIYNGILLLITVIIGHKADNVEILIPNGEIVGEKYFLLNSQINRFLGIPYAKPPVNELRFRRPVPIEKWNNRTEALAWPNNCVQKQWTDRLYRFRNKNYSEDCLYLNIWSQDVNVNEQNLRPVIVYIHGPNFINGGSSDWLNDPERMALMTDAVIVTFNYRLDLFGLLYSDRVDDVKGNQALWDQALALKWVNDNIRYFGGNPNAITLMGHKAGSWAVSIHLLSPVTRNLFQNAIMISGAVLDNFVLWPRQMIPEMLTAIRKLYCATENDNSITSDIVECLEKLDAETINQMDPIIPMVVIDGEFIPDDPEILIQNGQLKKEFNLMASTVDNEASFMFIDGYSFLSEENITLKRAKEIMIEIVNKLKKDRIDKEALLNIYFGGLNENYDDSDLFKKCIIKAISDYIFSCPTIQFAKNVFKSSPSTINVYQWQYDVKIGKIKDSCNKTTQICQSDVIYPIFAIPFNQQQYHFYHNLEREKSREIVTFIKSFIRNGNPGMDQSEWLKYFMINNGKDVVAPYYKITNEPKTHNSIKFNLKQLECEKIWKR